MRRRREIPSSVEDEVTLNLASWNRTLGWLRQLEAIRAVA
jgi:hypothetical protein